MDEFFSVYVWSNVSYPCPSCVSLSLSLPLQIKFRVPNIYLLLYDWHYNLNVHLSRKTSSFPFLFHFLLFTLFQFPIFCKVITLSENVLVLYEQNAMTIAKYRILFWSFFSIIFCFSLFFLFIFLWQNVSFSNHLKLLFFVFFYFKFKLVFSSKINLKTVK